MIAQATAFHEFRDDETQVPFTAHVEYRHDAGMLETGNTAGLSHEFISRMKAARLGEFL